jgi:hypothetical protein
VTIGLLIFLQDEHTATTETIMFAKSTKVLIAAFVLAGTSFAVVADASPRRHSTVRAHYTPVGWQTIDTTRPERHDPAYTN